MCVPASGALYVLWHSHQVQYVSACGAPPLGVGPVVAMPSFVVHRLEGAPQDLMDHIREAHNVPGEIRKVSLETFFPPWTVTRQVCTESLASRHSGISNDVLLFSDVGFITIECTRGAFRTLAFRGKYLAQLRALLPLPTVLPTAGGPPDAACLALPCMADPPDVLCAAPRPSRRAIGRRRPERVVETSVSTDRSPTHGAGPADCGGGCSV